MYQSPRAEEAKTPAGRGFLLFCDQDNAYPRVDWDFLQQVMKRMNIHPEFRQVLNCMYTNPETRFKVNGHTSTAPSFPCNGLIQGDPFAPIAYLLYFQTFLSLIKHPGPELPSITGVLIPLQAQGATPPVKRS